MKRKCQQCDKVVDWGEQINDWMDDYGEEWESFVMLTIFCHECDSYAGVIDMSEEVDTEEIKAPGFDKPIAFPKERKN